MGGDALTSSTLSMAARGELGFSRGGRPFSICCELALVLLSFGVTGLQSAIAWGAVYGVAPPVVSQH